MNLLSLVSFVIWYPKEDDSFPDENPYVLTNKDSDANNTKLDNIFKNLVFIHENK